MSQFALSAAATLRDAVAAIERSRRLIAAVVGADGQLLGILSDGDIRRALLAGRELDAPAADAMTRSPITALVSLRDDELVELMLSRGTAAVPVVDDLGRFVRIVHLLDFDSRSAEVAGEAHGYAAAVIMAGGEGKRLRPLTAERPKPMIDIGGVPLIERLVRAMVKSGLNRIYISTNYLGHLIEDHFGDGRNFGADIKYLREREKLGTAGALSLLPERPDGPILVVNGDVLTNSDFGKLLDYHRETQAFVTVGAVIYRVQIPFGVLRLKGHHAVGLEEKPSESFLCNAGIYVLGPEAFDFLPAAGAIDMTDLIAGAIAAGSNVSVFPIHEYWTDIGSPGDLQKALAEFQSEEAI